MFDPASGTWHIFRLNRATQTWSDTGTRIDNRPSTRGDALWDGKHLYVASNVLAASSTSNVAGQPARLYRYSYNTSRNLYALDAGFPVAINNYSSESLTLDKDSRGALWATWTQAQKVYVNSTNGTDSSWGTPYALSAPGAAGLSGDDISALAAYGKTKIGLMWSNQATSTFYFATHADGAARTAWTVTPILAGSSITDDHVDLKQLQGDSSGHLYAAVKTGLDLTGSPDAVQTMLLSLDPRTGDWETTDFGTVTDCHTRPLIVIDTSNQVLHMFATAPSTSSGCPGSGTPGTIYEKTTPLSRIAFAPGRGTPVIRDAASPWMNDITSTKQTITSTTGLVILASNTATQRYWHADIPIRSTAKPGSSVKPGVRFTATPASRQASLTIRFTGTATGGVTRWSWKFGDGRTASVRNPSHTYKKAGRYTVTLTGTTASGTRASSTRTIVVARPQK